MWTTTDPFMERFALVISGIGPWCLVERQADTAVSQTVTAVCGRTARVGNRFGQLFTWRIGDSVCKECARLIARERRP
ncbi:hypothetical protein AB0B45_46550 [Nonomuraea sp. NPDC049152]|uniref:hypothetical protein n=1 Tax=Nonomuraea sp. NPDC049152 TaxID=3154350 RepID=UPI0034000E56